MADVADVFLVQDENSGNWESGLDEDPTDHDTAHFAP